MATVEQLYQELLGRQADPGGLEYWQGKIGSDGVSEAERAEFLAAAQPELSSRGANVGETAIDQVYQQVLGRGYDPQGLQYWQNYFGTEISPEERAAFVAAAQPELARRQASEDANAANNAARAAAATTGAATAASPLSRYASAQQLYDEYLGREADPEGLKFWQNYFGNEIDQNELAAFQAAARPELTSRAPTVVDQWYNEALKRPADESGRAYWLDQINKVGFNQARNMFYNQAVRELLGRTAVNVPTTPTRTPDVIGSNLPGGSAYQPTTINVGGAGAVTSGGFAAYPYNQTQAAAALGRPAFDVTQYMMQNPVQPFVATPLFAPGQVPFIPNPYVPSPYSQQIPTTPPKAGTGSGGLFGGGGG